VSGSKGNRGASIWFAPPRLEEIAAHGRRTMIEYLGIRVTAIGADWVSGTMPVDHRTHQPLGLLHGGASVALAETLGSIGGSLCLDPEKQRCVGLDINANHLRSVTTGFVTGTARPLHLGRRTQVWQIEIRDPAEGLTCISRLTLAVLDLPQSRDATVSRGD
jgi:1,4-dihydroxy-2-naphthoyl-CoA hydrolase